MQYDRSVYNQFLLVFRPETVSFGRACPLEINVNGD